MNTQVLTQKWTIQQGQHTNMHHTCMCMNARIDTHTCLHKISNFQLFETQWGVSSNMFFDFMTP